MEILRDIKPSPDAPTFKENLECRKLFYKYKRFLKRVPMSPYLEIGFLPYGDGVGYLNHPFEMIDELEYVRDCFNDAITVYEESKPKKPSRR